MDDAPAPVSRGTVVRIGIRGLPDLASSMLGGGLYVLIAKTTSARFPLLAGSIARALEDGLESAVIVSANPAQFIQRIESLARLDTAALVAAQRLQLFMLQDNFLKKMFQFGASRFVSELEDFGIPENSYLVFDQADELLSLHDVSLADEQVSVLKEWFARKGITALLVFSRLSDAHSSTVNAIMDSLDGIVRLGSEKDGLALSFDYWQSPTAVTVAKNYQLTTLDSGLYEASDHAQMAMSIVRENMYPPQLLGQQFTAQTATSPANTKPLSATLQKYKGYLKPKDFLRELGLVLDQVSPDTVPCTVVVGTPVQGMNMGDIVRRYDRSARLGELITADDNHCYICLSTDSKTQALETLQIILGLPVGAVFSQDRLSNDREDIRLSLGELLHAVQRGTWPDFTSVHDVAAVLQPSGLSQPRNGEHPPKSTADNRPFAPHVVNVRAASSDEEDHEVLRLDFEPARRSNTAYARIFDRAEPVLVDSIYINAHNQPIEDIVFDADDDLHGPVFGQSEAPRAKRSVN
ncbi:MAG: hypothetical protein KGZ67_04295 [Hydrogenophaga sp.]|jgi:hypothetical protein|nr:hypothetical protein [Hydrogenophaga sp.]